MLVDEQQHREAAWRSLPTLGARLIECREHERRLISEELHDSTVQHLVSIDLALMRLKQRIAADNSATELISDIECSLDHAMRELRTATYLMHPLDLQQSDLTTVLETYCEGFARRTNIAVHFRCEAMLDQLIPGAQKALLRVVQEALTNVYKHARASQVSVRCRRRNGLLHLVIADDGITHRLRRSACLRIGVGLSSMRFRLSQFGGSLKLTTSRRGTIVHCMLPADVIQFRPAGVFTSRCTVAPGSSLPA